MNSLRISAMYKDKEREHPGSQPEFRSRVVRRKIQYNLNRFIMEGIRIQKASLEA